MVQSIINKLRKCDDFHKRCDYLLDHSEITHLLSYINYLERKCKFTKVHCKECDDIICGDGKGTYISCSCGKIAIDETENYTRIIGNEEDYTVLKGE